MKALSLPLFFFSFGMWAQTVPLPPAGAAPATMPDLPDHAVIATFDDGVTMTMGEFRRIHAILPPQNQQMALRDKAAFLHQWALMRKLSKMADADKLNERSPSKEALDYYHMMVMSQAKINDTVNSATVEPDEVVKYYDSNKEKYKQVRVKAIYISFSANAAGASSAAKKPLTEDAAKAKADKLLKDLRGGGDFVKAAKDHSDDETSRGKDGDFATLRPVDNIPDPIKKAVFALKQGDVSEAVRQPNGFYIFRAEEVSHRPLSQVRDEIFSELKQESFKVWMDKTDKETKVTFNNPAFLGLTPTPPIPAK